MSDAGNEKVTQERRWPARVIRVVTDTRLIINRGAIHGVRMDQRFLVYEVEDEDIIDPVTNKRLGKLETPKGTGTVVNIESEWAMIESDMFAGNRGYTWRVDLEGRVSFSGAEVGDLAKPV